jgi:hypothetical protein
LLLKSKQRNDRGELNQNPRRKNSFPVENEGGSVCERQR